jgi:hypothetical protein
MNSDDTHESTLLHRMTVATGNMRTAEHKITTVGVP